jgi:hypothetical protein
VVVFGDMGTAQPDGSVPFFDSPPQYRHYDSEPNSRNTTSRLTTLIEDGGASLVLHIGDLSYARGWAQGTWDFFGHQIERIASRVPYLTCQGNHEVNCPNGDPTNPFPNSTDSGGEGGIPSLRRYPPVASNPDQQYYSFEWGNIHFLVLSTEIAFDVHSAQYQFVLNDLAGVDRARTPWLVAVGHRPMYISSTYWQYPVGDQDVAIVLRATYEQLFADHRVNLALWGHHHSLQYTFPVFNERVVKQGTVHGVVGNAGFELTTGMEWPMPAHFQHQDATVFGYTVLDTTDPNVLEVHSFASDDNRLLYKVAVPPWVDLEATE